jgi:hypothetical protein
MSAAILRGPAAALICTAISAMSPLAAEPVALRSYNAPIGENSISVVSSGAFMAVQFGTAWSSIIKGVGVVAGGPYWCAKADAYDAITWYWGPVWRATGSCMKGPASDRNVSGFIAKADAKAAAGDIDPLKNLSRQKIYLFHGYNEAVVPALLGSFGRHPSPVATGGLPPEAGVTPVLRSLTRRADEWPT